ncbi:hypothetical protein GL267_012595 [Acidithiobacillus ferrianus]|uniref:Uncharacterized protein n=2 Tax=Acidithiobacillus ferrianus TaxID=2678518 RepID=A0A845U9K2_9PROT|nr:hypothetical protein [Acidithiobacillus ferrianus]NDU42839.1 hypothetical protein [Acidithiobacillus ferrianus]
MDALHPGRHRLKFATTVADRDGALFPKLEMFMPEITRRFPVIGCIATHSTDRRVLCLLESAGVRLATIRADPDAIGRHRREAVALALRGAEQDHIFYADLDHVLRWVENQADEFNTVLDAVIGQDCVVIGRGPQSKAALPRRLAMTEAIVNEIFGLITGHSWDLMMAARGLSHRAAVSIVNGCIVDTVGNDVAWPLFCRQRGFSLGYLEADGLTYRTNTDYAHDIADARDQDPHAWMMRMHLACQHIEAMRPYLAIAQ